MSEGRQQILDVRKALEKKYDDLGTGLFPPLDGKTQIDVIPTPSAIINAIVGVGGFPRGRIVEIFGPESTGKTTLAIEAMIACQKADPDAVILFVDYEHTFDHTYAARLGLDVTDPARFIYCMPDYFEMGAEVIQQFVTAGLVDMVAIDSVAAMIPLSTYEGEIDKGADEGKTKIGRVGLHAQLMSQTLNWLTKRISRGRKPAIVAINQTRMKLNLRYGTATAESTGGGALKFYSTIRLELGRARGEGKEGRSSADPLDQLHQQARVVVTCVKNKVAAPWMRGAMVIKPNRGICNVDSTADLAIMYLDIKGGAWFKYDGPTPELSFSVQGREALLGLLEGDPALLEHLQKEALDKLHRTHDRELKPREQSESTKKRRIKRNEPKEERPKPADDGAHGDLEIEDA